MVQSLLEIYPGFSKKASDLTVAMTYFAFFMKKKKKKKKKKSPVEPASCAV
jgi:hypothetical protein